MATVNFLYRSTREEAPLTLRLLYSYNGKNYVFGAKTKYKIEKKYWKNDHFKNRKDAYIKNKKIKVNNDLQQIENFILNEFHETEITRVDKKWLVEQIGLYYNPPETLEEEKTKRVSN